MTKILATGSHSLLLQMQNPIASMEKSGSFSERLTFIYHATLLLGVYPSEMKTMLK